MTLKITETDSYINITGEAECSSCNGTGLYKGMSENGGAAVVCHYCNGTGKTTINNTINKFTGRKHRDNVKRVYKTAGGYAISDKDVVTKEGKCINFSLYGASYEDWLDGKEPRGIEDLHCPYMHTSQQLQNNDVNNLYNTRCKDNRRLGSTISNCPLFCDKATCWRIFNQGK